MLNHNLILQVDVRNYLEVVNVVHKVFKMLTLDLP